MATPALFSQKNPPRESRRLLSERFCKTLSCALSMTEAELRPLLNFDQNAISIAAGRQLHEDGAIHRPKILVSGWACQQRILEDGRRQIFSFFVPGDVFDCRHIGMSHGNIIALTNVVLLDATQLEQKGRMPGAHAGLAQYFTTMEQRHISFLYNHILRLGSETAYERLRSLLKELFRRLSKAGYCYNGSVHLPLTQETLADALGMSAVHTNRVLQQMRRDGTMEFQDGRLIFGPDLGES